MHGAPNGLEIPKLSMIINSFKRLNTVSVLPFKPRGLTLHNYKVQYQIIATTLLRNLNTTNN